MEVHTSSFNPPMRKGVHPSKVVAPVRPAPPLQHEIISLGDEKTILEKDVAIPMRDGIKLYANVYRPTAGTVKKTPSIVLFSPFGKHGGIPLDLFQNMGVDFESLSKHTLWELPDPLVWCGEYGYSLVVVDARGTWWSEGEAAYYFSPEEGRDGYDIVEWIAKQDWNTGKVGWGAVSYYAMSIYQTAVLKPPHLAAIMAWEGMSDIYREVNVVGGIPSVPFQHYWMSLTGNGLGWNENAATMPLEQPMFTDLWSSKVVDWSKIDIPAFSVTGWSSLALHLRGTIGSWNAFQSAQKYLWVHSLREWEAYYSPDGQRRQKAFWDRFLRDKVNEVDEWSPVELEVRERFGKAVTRFEPSWPPPTSKLTAFALGAEGRLVSDATSTPGTSGSVSFTSHHPGSSVQWEHKFQTRTEITGNSSLTLHLQTLQSPDADLYVAVQKLSKDGKQVMWYNITQIAEASAMHGWLRVSHREKDGSASVPGRPVHTHQRRLWLQQSDVVKVEVEIWPSSTIWEAGETLRLVVQGHSFFDQNIAMVSRRSHSHNFGEVKIWFGGDFDSHLLLPVITQKSPQQTDRQERCLPYSRMI